VKAPDKRRLASDAAARYLREVGRKRQKGIEPNDRSHDRKFEQKLKRLPPEDVDALFRGDED